MIVPSDLLVVGGLSIDRFPGRREAPGGSVLHAARALTMAGLRGATITVVGPEETARAGLRKLRSLGAVIARDAPWSIRFAIDERRAPRTIVYEAGASLTFSPADLALLPSRALLIAPIAGELTAASLAATTTATIRVAALQGWLRVLVPGEPVVVRPLSSLGEDLREAMAGMTAIVASGEDLGAVSEDAGRALTALRDWAGAVPVLAVTTGEGGVQLDVPRAGRTTVPLPRVVTGVPTLGAGDAFAAVLAVGLGRGVAPVLATRQAVASAGAYLASRR